MPTLSAVKEKLIYYVSLIGKNTNNCQRENIGRRIDVNNATGEKTEAGPDIATFFHLSRSGN